MSEARDLRRMTYAEYVEFEARSETKHEWADGRVYERIDGMSGGSAEHARLQMRMGVVLTAALADRPCAPFTSDLRIYVASARRGRYPDLSVICDAIEHDAADPLAATNPSVLVEVLSPTTEADDRGEKWALYQRIPSLSHYVLVSQHRPRIEVFTRTELGWHYTESVAGGHVVLGKLDVTLSIDEIYAGALATPPAAEA